MVNVVFCCGRLNPVTLGHVKLFKEMGELAQQTARKIVFVTCTVDAERNPLVPNEKIGFVSRIFDGEVYAESHPYSVVERLAAEKVKTATFCVGEDRGIQFEPLCRYAETLGVHLTLKVIDRPIDDVSATKVREAAWQDDFGTFSQLVPNPPDDRDFQQDLYHALRRGMGVENAYSGVAK